MAKRPRTRQDKHAAPVDWRELTPDDFPSLREFVGACERSNLLPYQTSPSEIDEWTGAGALWRGRALSNNEGEPLAYLLASVSSEDRACTVRSYLHPSLEPPRPWAEIVEWQLAAGRALLKEGGTPGDRRIITRVHPHHVHLEAELRSRGFSWVSSAIELRRDLKDLPDQPELGAYLQVVPWDAEHAAAARRLYNQLLAKGPTLGMNREEWEEQLATADLGWSFMAFSTAADRPELVGFVLAGEDEAAPETIGWTQGYLEVVAIADCPDAGILFRALVGESMRAQQEDGKERVATTVEAPGDPNTERLYESLGFALEYEVKTYSYSA